MSILTDIGIDWMPLRYYLLGPIGIALALFILPASSLKNRLLFRRIGAGFAMLWNIGMAFAIDLSAHHVSRFEELLLSALVLILVLFLDWKLHPD
jgi:hypothetical protein